MSCWLTGAVPQPERPDESRAADLVRGLTGADLSFTGALGGIDYTGTHDGRRVILEVTRFTRHELIRDWLAAADHHDSVRLLPTANCWVATFDGYPRYTDLEARLGPALRDLETHGIFGYYAPDMYWWMVHVPTLADALARLSGDRVIDVRVFDAKPGTEPQLFVSSSGGWSYGGPDAALETVERYLVDEKKHLAKTIAEPADERHLFLWSDAATPESLTKAFTEWWPTQPGRSPSLPEELDHLWVVHEPSLRGWHWSESAGWAQVG